MAGIISSDLHVTIIFYTRSRFAKAENRNVPAEGNVDDDRIVNPLRCVVFSEFPAQSPCLTTDNRVDLRIIIRGAAEDENTDCGFLNVACFSFESCFDYEGEELNKPLTAPHHLTLTDSFESVPNYGVGQSAKGVPQIRSDGRGSIRRSFEFSSHVVPDARVNRVGPINR